ncbi:uncharacterized protein LOC136026024 [Artemia franciscana]|uniref:Uncharacterized protein n=2 Tax=Artemia franciscana TaxID=6661 RepID=A0AA88HM18_ARTSF|nr:hypothetical protein QYM36_012911 [Artemia franciscana]KAK2711949.1 hypothetical protein QYM36_012911 [Artemia franciscana]KAK2711950.1 hypothetical protein QYM36_012911 [Artemia franciscana]KAK2711951.1 hypothetical protein QYM36_012911 [Artemia franciscana]
MVEETQSTGTNTDVFSVFQFEESCQEYLPAPSVLVELYDQLIINNGVLPIKWKPQFGKKIHEEKQQPTTTSAPKESQRFPEEVHTSQQEEEKRDTSKFLIEDFESEETPSVPRLGLQRKPTQVKKKVASFDSILNSMLKNKDEIISNK